MDLAFLNRSRGAPTSSPSAPPPMRVSWRVLSRIRAAIGRAPFETGGPLGMDTRNAITAFQFDASAAVSSVTYEPDVARLNRMFRENWNRRGLRLAGFVHSHPPGFLEPSEGDRIYAARLLAALPHLDRFYLPIVRSRADGGGFEFRPFAAIRDPARGARLAACGLIVVD